jgi:hypothetical protein
MSENALRRIRADLAVMQRALGLAVSYRKGMLLFGLLLAVAAVAAALISLRIEDDRLQLVPMVAILVSGLVGLYLHTRRGSLPPESILQVVVSLTLYAAVWVAAYGYVLAIVLGPSIGAARAAALYGSSIGLLLVSSVMLVRSAVKNREQYYALGLAISPLLAGMLLPIVGRPYSYPLAHGLMAVGYLTAVAIQWVQLRSTVALHAAD